MGIVAIWFVVAALLISAVAYNRAAIGLRGRFLAGAIAVASVWPLFAAFSIFLGVGLAGNALANWLIVDASDRSEGESSQSSWTCASCGRSRGLVSARSFELPRYTPKEIDAALREEERERRRREETTTLWVVLAFVAAGVCGWVAYAASLPVSP